MVGQKRALGCSQSCAEPANLSPGGTRGGEGQGVPPGRPGASAQVPAGRPVGQGLGWRAGLQSVLIPLPRCWLPTRLLVSVSRPVPTMGKGSSAVLGVESQGLQREREHRKGNRGPLGLSPAQGAPQPTLEESSVEWPCGSVPLTVALNTCLY